MSGSLEVRPTISTPVLQRRPVRPSFPPRRPAAALHPLQGPRQGSSPNHGPSTIGLIHTLLKATRTRQAPANRFARPSRIRPALAGQIAMSATFSEFGGRTSIPNKPRPLPPSTFIDGRCRAFGWRRTEWSLKSFPRRKRNFQGWRPPATDKAVGRPPPAPHRCMRGARRVAAVPMTSPPCWLWASLGRRAHAPSASHAA